MNEKIMNNENTATAMAVSEPSGIETRSAVRLEWTPESLSLEIEREKQMRSILQTYMRDAMIAEHHYYSFKEGDKPALTQEGAHNICSVFKTIIGPPELHETFHDDGHYSVRARVEIFNQATERIATGDGICSTKESKYAYRWAWPGDVPDGFDKSTLKSKSGEKRGGGKWIQYQMPNQDLPDLYNTVLKMAVKRAKVAGVRQLPLVSELFAPDDGGHDNEPTKQPAGRASDTNATRKATSPVPQKQEETAVDKAIKLAAKLRENGIEEEDIAIQFLPEGVARFEDLSIDQADEAMPTMIAALNAAVKKR